jgi:hypothetical protein
LSGRTPGKAESDCPPSLCLFISLRLIFIKPNTWLFCPALCGCGFSVGKTLAQKRAAFHRENCRVEQSGTLQFCLISLSSLRAKPDRRRRLIWRLSCLRYATLFENGKNGS